jgi:hypothetical protein
MNVNQQVADLMDRLARIDKELDAEEKAKRKRIAQRRQQAEFEKDLEEKMKEIEL